MKCRWCKCTAVDINKPRMLGAEKVDDRWIRGDTWHEKIKIKKWIKINNKRVWM